jgi:hypothetical protein
VHLFHLLHVSNELLAHLLGQGIQARRVAECDDSNLLFDGRGDKMVATGRGGDGGAGRRQGASASGDSTTNLKPQHVQSSCDTALPAGIISHGDLSAELCADLLRLFCPLDPPPNLPEEG